MLPHAAHAMNYRRDCHQSWCRALAPSVRSTALATPESICRSCKVFVMDGRLVQAKAGLMMKKKGQRENRRVKSKPPWVFSAGETSNYVRQAGWLDSTSGLPGRAHHAGTSLLNLCTANSTPMGVCHKSTS